MTASGKENGMDRHVLVINILPEDYDAFVKLAPVDGCFPDTYEEWFKRRSDENRWRLARRDILDDVVIHPQEFREYCKTTGLPLSRITLEAAAVKKLYGP